MCRDALVNQKMISANDPYYLNELTILENETSSLESSHSVKDINYSDFLAAAMLKRVHISEEKLVLAFHKLDTHRLGYIDVNELRASLLGELGTGGDNGEEGGAESNELRQIDNMLSQLDVNRDGRIEYDEFLTFWNALVKAVRNESSNMLAVARFQKSVTSVVNQLKFVKSLQQKTVMRKKSRELLEATESMSMDQAI